MGTTGSDLDVVVCWDDHHDDAASGSSSRRSESLEGQTTGVQGRHQAPAYSIQRLAAALRRERRWVRVAKVLDRGKLPIIKVRARAHMTTDARIASRRGVSMNAHAVVSRGCSHLLVAKLPTIFKFSISVFYKQAEARADVDWDALSNSKHNRSLSGGAAAGDDDAWPPGCPTVSLDISMLAPGHTGLVSTAFVKELVAQLPPLRSLCLVTKQLLKATKLRSLACSLDGSRARLCLCVRAPALFLLAGLLLRLSDFVTFVWLVIF